jgi:hypothetical protein
MKDNKKSKFDEAINLIVIILVGTLLAYSTDIQFWFASGLIAMSLMYLLSYIKKWKYQNTFKTSISLFFGGFFTLLIVIIFAIILELNKRQNSKIFSKEELKEITKDLKEKFFLRDGFLGIGTLTKENENFIEISVSNEEAYQDILGYMTYQGYNEKIYKIIIREKTTIQ